MPQLVPVDHDPFEGQPASGMPDPFDTSGVHLAGINPMLDLQNGLGAAAPVARPVPPPVEPMTAYHGSPHDFDAFSTEKIGAGEGAQRQGYGLFFTESEKVARGYVTAGASTRPSGVATMWLNRFGDRESAAASLENTNPKAADLLRDPKWTPDQPTEYQVKIHVDPNRMIEWSAPTAEQSDVVQQAFKKLGAEGETGRKAYQDLSAKLRGDAVASAALRNEGVQGSSYFTQNGDRNHVIYNSDDVEITHKNGNPIKLTPVDHDPFADASASP